MYIGVLVENLRTGSWYMFGWASYTY